MTTNSLGFDLAPEDITDAELVARWTRIAQRAPSLPDHTGDNSCRRCAGVLLTDAMDANYRLGAHFDAELCTLAAEIAVGIRTERPWVDLETLIADADGDDSPLRALVTQARNDRASVEAVANARHRDASGRFVRLATTDR